MLLSTLHRTTKIRTFFPTKRVLSTPSINTYRPSIGLEVIRDIIQALSTTAWTPTKHTKKGIVQDILTIEYQKYLDRQKATSTNSHLIRFINAIPAHLEMNEKINLLTTPLLKYFAMPVITAHPTRVFSNEATFELYNIIELIAEYEKHSYDTRHKQELLQQLHQKISTLIEHSMLPSKNMTQKEEADATSYIHKNILKTFPDFSASIVDAFVKAHGGDRKTIARALKAALMKSYQHIGDWSKCDADGNHTVIATTMEQLRPTQQIALLELYIEQIDNILAKVDLTQAHLFDSLREKRNQFVQSIRDIHDGSWFDKNAAQQKKLRTFVILDELLSHFSESSPVYKRIMGLRDIIELGGFYGDLKEYARQTTMMHKEVFNDFSQTLAKYYPEIRAILQGQGDDLRPYEKLAKEEQVALHHQLSSNSQYFKTLHQHASEWSQKTHDELGRLYFIYQNQNTFSGYIFSDTQDESDFNRASIGMHFAAYHFEGGLHMPPIETYLFLPMTLCETEMDLQEYPRMLRAMLDDVHIRQKIVARGYISGMLGPSDNTKGYGLLVYGLLLRVEAIGAAILKEYQEIYPELKVVFFLWKHGFGPDMKRQFGDPKYQLHRTDQGWGAFNALAAPMAYPALLHGLIGRPSASQFKIQEIQHLKQHAPQTYQAWIDIEQEAMMFFSSFITQPRVQQLLAYMTDSRLERKMNTSSRAGSKKSPEPHAARAIGIVNHYLIGGDFWDIYMSIAGLAHLSQEQKQHLPRLFQQLTVCKDIVYKIFFSLAISDNSHLWARLNKEESQIPPEERYHSVEYQKISAYKATLTDMNKNKYQVLEVLIAFLSPLDQQKANLYFNPARQSHTPAHEIALHLMEILGGEFAELADDTKNRLPYFQRFRACVELYRENPCAETEENAVLAGRGIQLAEAPPTIANLISPLHEQALKQPFAPIEASEPTMSMAYH